MAAKYPAALVALGDLGGLLAGIPNSTAVLSGAHTDVVATITLTAAPPATWPTKGWVVIDNEAILYTGKGATTLTGCTRGQLDTTAAAHSDAATVRLGLTKGTINQVLEELVALEATLGKNFITQYAAGNSGAALTIDWANGDTQTVTLTGNCTFTFSNPTAGHYYTLRLAQDATGSRTVTWPAAVKWPGGTVPTLTTTASRVDVITFYYDGTNYLGQSSLNYSV